MHFYRVTFLLLLATTEAFGTFFPNCREYLENANPPISHDEIHRIVTIAESSYTPKISESLSKEDFNKLGQASFYYTNLFNEFCSKWNASKSPNKLKIKPMDFEYIFEQLEIQFFTKKEFHLRLDYGNQYKVHFKNGLIYDSQNRPLDTTSWFMISDELSIDMAIFVLDGVGNLYLAPQSNIDGNRNYHSYLSGGLPTAAAGEIRLRNGQITYISNQSGHYKHDYATFKQIFSIFKKNNVKNQALREYEAHLKKLYLSNKKSGSSLLRKKL
jgi:hypothetical protein